MDTINPAIEEILVVDVYPHIEFMNGAVEAARENYIETQRAEHKEEANWQFTETLLDEAKIYEDALLELFKQSRNIGQAILATLWHIHLNGLIQFLGYDVESDLARWAEEKFAEYASPKYIAQLCGVVENVFQDVYVRETNGNPYLDDVNLPITVDGLISQYGLVNKLQTILFAYSQPGTTREQKQELLTAVRNGRRKDVEAKRDEVLNNGVKIKLHYRTVTTPEGKINVLFPNIDGDALHLLVSLLGEAAEETFA